MTDYANNVTILLIEDDDVDAMAIERGFKKQEILNPMVRAGDGIVALEMLRAGRVASPYIILLDLQMPRMNGIEFLENLRADPELKSSVVFVLTTSRNDEDITASYQQNIAGYFVKRRLDAGFYDIIGLLRGYWKKSCLPGADPAKSSTARP